MLHARSSALVRVASGCRHLFAAMQPSTGAVSAATARLASTPDPAASKLPAGAYPVRTDWTRQEVAAVYRLPFAELLFRAASAHRQYFDPLEVQRCTLLSIKTGGCTEDCKYCAQSTRYSTTVKAEPLMQLDSVLSAARRAKDAGSTRFCMGTAWRELGAKKTAFNRVLEMVREVRKLDLEVCCTLGMLSEDQAHQLKDAGLSAYNHNLDTSREHYPNVISTRSYDDRLATIANVRKAGITVCCGGILGLGEKETDRIGLLHELATMEKHPESVPINALVPVDGTPLEESNPPDVFEMARTIATARVVMPSSMVRLSAGRLTFSELEQVTSNPALRPNPRSTLPPPPPPWRPPAPLTPPPPPRPHAASAPPPPRLHPASTPPPPHPAPTPPHRPSCSWLVPTPSSRETSSSPLRTPHLTRTRSSLQSSGCMDGPHSVPRPYTRQHVE